MSLTDVETATVAAEAAARVHRSWAGRQLGRHWKSGADFATDVDVAAEAAVLAVLREQRPHDAVIAEESGRSGPQDAERVWLVDPLCGTLNYAAGQGPYGASVTLTRGDDVLAAAVAEPHRLTWTDGTRAFTRVAGRDEPTAPSASSRIVEILMETVDPDEQGFSSARFWRSPALRTLSPRFVGTGIALAWVATGLRAGFVLPGWREASVHFSSGIGICRAAGCVLTDLRGGPLHLGHDGLLCAADAATHALLLAGVAEQLG
ncbi:inositol monophosphatase family protein [uncultured Actinomyces sp.]|uniref:inositol monophosphatase family protein n=1 Tax=uncultured Actinomyces sp. TaxID=249061 RepID=UPI00261C28AC|nr:inositol monophosphatase family protein [uncultured Actinomyces sp.]